MSLGISETRWDARSRMLKRQSRSALTEVSSVWKTGFPKLACHKPVFSNANIAVFIVLELERRNDFLDLLRDDVALDEVRHVEDFAEDAFGEDVLDDHLLDGFEGDVGIERAAAEGAEVFKGGDEFLVGLAFLFDEGFEARADLRDAFLEFGDGFFPFGNRGRG